MTISTVDNRAIFRLAIATLFVLAFPLLFEMTFSEHVREGEYNSRLGWTFILLLSAIVFQKRWLHTILLVPFIIGGSIDIGYAINFGSVFTTATVEALINTDISEVTEYGATYSSPLLFSIIAVYWTLSFLLLKGMSFDFSKTKVRTGFIVFGVILTLVAGYRVTVLERYHDTIPGVLGSLPSYYKGHIGLQQEIDLRKQLLSSIDQDAKILNAEDTQTYIFFIGESINRNPMSVYGYHRTTTPKIDAMANELIVFNDVNGYEDDLSANKINEYDNSIRYTNHVYDQAYKLIEQDSANIKALTLLSDHGEEIFDSIIIKGHSPDNVTANMLETPMIIWLSEDYKESRAETVSAMLSNREKSFRLDNFYHFATELMGIRSVYVIEKDSLSSSSFLAPSERHVYNKSYERELKQTQLKQTEIIADKK